MEILTSPELLIALLTLAVLEIVLGVDNVIFISILSAKLPKEQQKKARRVGLLAAMVMRIGLLFSLSWLAQLTTPLFTIMEKGTTNWKDRNGTARPRWRPRLRRSSRR